MPTDPKYLRRRATSCIDDLVQRIETVEAERNYWIDRCKGYEQRIRELNNGLLAQGRELAQCRECLSEDVADEYPKVLGVAHIPTLPPCAYVALEIAEGKSHHLYVPPSVYSETLAWAKRQAGSDWQRRLIDEALEVWALNNYDDSPGTQSGPSTESEWVEGHRVLTDDE